MISSLHESVYMIYFCYLISYYPATQLKAFPRYLLVSSAIEFIRLTASHEYAKQTFLKASYSKAL